MYWEYVIVGYVVVLGGLGLYSAAILRQGRNLSRRVPPEKRRFLD
ncbi:MAG: hypothetical protein AAF467_04445 [Actinomycetota bacterium]